MVTVIPTDIDECARNGHNCDTNADCSDTDGSFVCSCNDGFSGNGTSGQCFGEHPNNYILQLCEFYCNNYG